jgi:esterase/lipase superfamily enzyme
MKTLLLALTLLTAMTFTAPAADAGKPAKSKKLVHMVSFKFKSTAQPAQIDEVVTAFRGLKKKISEIKSFEWGTNVSPEKHDKGFTHGFILTFKDAAARDAYLVHPDHQAFGKLVGPVLEDVFVIDYWAQP